MARGSLSPESIIQNDLRVLRCSHRNFCSIAGFPYGTFAMVLAAGTKTFDRAQAERLREKLQQMKELEQSVGVPVDWSRTEEVANVLALRLMKKILEEQHESSEQWSKLAEDATERMVSNS